MSRKANEGASANGKRPVRVNGTVSEMNGTE